MDRLFQSSILSVFLAALISGCASGGPRELSTEEKKADIYYAHGTGQLVRKQYTEALDNLLKAYKLRPDDSKTLNNLGMAYYFKGEKTKAIDYLKRAIDEDSKNSDAKNNLASIYFKMKKYKLAKAQYLAITKDLVYRGQYRVYYNLALIELNRGNSFQAINYLNRSLKERYDYCPSHFKLGEIHREAGDLNKAYDWFQEASKGTCYNLPGPLYEQGRTLAMMGKHDRAKAKFEELKRRFEKTRYNALADVELKKIDRMGSQEKFVNTDEELEVQNF